MSDMPQSALPPQPPVGSFPPPVLPPQAPPRRRGLGIAALVLAIVAGCLLWIPFVSYAMIGVAGLAVVLGVVAIIVRQRGLGIAGTAIGVVALILAIVMSLFYSALFHAVDTAVSTLPDASASAAPVSPTSPSVPAAPAGTAAQLQSLAAAQGYLASGQGFSQAGLIAQLTSDYGNGFAPADAQWAVEHSGADWNAQAVIAAKGYLGSGLGFSRQSLIEQLTSSFGSQFTEAQAEYAADQVGLK